MPVDVPKCSKSPDVLLVLLLQRPNAGEKEEKAEDGGSPPPHLATDPRLSKCSSLVFVPCCFLLSSCVFFVKTVGFLQVDCLP